MYTLPLTQLTKKDLFKAGQKGAILGELAHLGFPVPRGFIILAEVFDGFLKETDINIEIKSLMKEINYHDLNSINGVSVKIKNLFDRYDIADHFSEELFEQWNKLRLHNVAVRSSVTVEDYKISAWSGELRTYLNINKKNLLESVKNCWFSLFTPRALFYRYDKKLRRQKICLAIIIEEMVDAEISGVCFTANPLTGDKTQMVIEAVLGLGVGVVEHKFTPDTYTIQKEPTKDFNPDLCPDGDCGQEIITKMNQLEIIDKNISTQTHRIVCAHHHTKEDKVSKSKQDKQKLDDTKILNLSSLASRIEKHFGTPQHIEWAYHQSHFHILQSRPIAKL